MGISAIVQRRLLLSILQAHFGDTVKVSARSCVRVSFMAAC